MTRARRFTFRCRKQPAQSDMETSVDNAIEQKRDFARESKWTESIAVGNENFLTRVKKKMQALSVGRRVRPTTEGFELRETIDPYNSHFEAEKCDIDAKNTWFRNIYNKIPVC